MSRRFTLLDDPYYDALLLVRDALAARGLAFCLVGGGAAQARIASLLTGDGTRRLRDEPALAGVLRRTRDLDFSTRAEPADMVGLLNELAATSGREAHVLGPRAARLGPVSVSFTIEPGDLAGMSDRYDAFLDGRSGVRLRRGPNADEIPTIGLEDLLATKLTRRGDKAKDLLDVARLLDALEQAGRSVDVERLRGLIGADAEASAFVAEIEERLRGKP